MRSTVVFTPEAADHLTNLDHYIATHATPVVDHRYVEALVDRCLAIALAPRSGTPHDDIYPGLRTIAFRKGTAIAYRIVGNRIEIADVFHGGCDLERQHGG